MDETPPLEDLIELVERRHPVGNPLDYLTESVLVSAQLEELADDLVGYFVDVARQAGASWAEVGESLGVTKQAAQKRFVASVKTKKRRGLFTRFSSEARQVVIRAQDRAREAGSPHVGTEHILLGLVEDDGSLASRAIVACDVPLAQVADMARVDPRPEVLPVRGHIPFSADAKKVLELSLRESLRLGQNYIGTEHILLGMLRDEGSPGAKVLIGLGVTRSKMEGWLAA